MEIPPGRAKCIWAVSGQDSGKAGGHVGDEAVLGKHVVGLESSPPRVRGRDGHPSPGLLDPKATLRGGRGSRVSRSQSGFGWSIVHSGIGPKDFFGGKFLLNRRFE